MKAAWICRLDVRLALAALLGLLVTGAALLAWQEMQWREHEDAVVQRQSLGLAHYVVQRRGDAFADAQQRLRPDGLADIGMYISMIHPSLEAYLVDTTGRIVAHTLPPGSPARQHVDLAPVRALAHSQVAPELPMYGEDPRTRDGRALVSLAPVGQAGYLYLVLLGEQAARLREESVASSWRTTGWWLLGAALLLGGMVIVGLQWAVTRRIRHLAGELEAFRNARPASTAESVAAVAKRGDEIDQLRATAQALQERVQLQIHQLEDSERQRSELVSNISHDLHTPLANIRGWLDTLLLSGERLSAAEREQYLRTAVRHCAGLSRRVRELFELSRLESLDAVARPEPFCMTELLHDVIQAHQLSARERGIALRLAEDSIPAPVMADIALIERVLNNLVDNALRHTAAGGMVELAVAVDAERVWVSVADTGRGIASEDLPHIFKRYWTTREPAEGNDHRPGTGGLGLAVVQRIVELHGGLVDVRSALNRGTEICFALPYWTQPA